MSRSLRAWRWAFKLSFLVAFFPSSCFRRCHSRCCLVRLRCVLLSRGPHVFVRHRCDVVDCAMASMEVSRACSADARIAHWPRRFLVRSSLVHDVLRVVFPRVGLRAAALRCEQQHSKEWKEGLPHQCEELPPSSLKHSRGRHSCRSAFSKQIGSNVARNRSVFVRSRLSESGFCARGAETRPGGVARPLLQSRKVPRPGWRGTRLSKASLKPWRQVAVTITDCCP